MTRGFGTKRADKSTGVVPDYFLEMKPGSTFEQYQSHLLKIRMDKHGIDVPTYLSMGEEQGWKCKACGAGLDKYSDQTNIDHDHECCPSEGANGKALVKNCGRCIRGLLCMRCNMLEGQLTSDPVRVRQIIQYLKTTGYRDVGLLQDILKMLDEVAV